MWHSLKLATCILIFCHAAIVQTDSGPLVRCESQTSGWLAMSFPLVHIVQIETYDCVFINDIIIHWFNQYYCCCMNVLNVCCAAFPKLASAVKCFMLSVIVGGYVFVGMSVALTL